MLHGESVHSMLPQDIPWWRPDHAIFFAILYAVILILVSGLGLVFLRSIFQTIKEKFYSH